MKKYLFFIGIAALFAACGNHNNRESNYTDTAYINYGPPALQEPFQTDNYHPIDENGFKDAARIPLSTFAADVDKASYSNMRSFIMRGQLPPADAVRVEELINYFNYDYPQPTDEHPFSITLEGSPCPWNNGHQLVMVGIKGKEIPIEETKASNLVFLVDVSGSMDAPDKLGLVKSGLKLLVNELGEQDYVTIVVYASAEGLALPPTSGANKKEIIASLDRLAAGGSTAGGAGIKLAYKMAREHFMEGGNNRVILATDGDFNVGISSDGALQDLIEQERRSGVFLSILGVGHGNLMDGRMNMLAGKGNGEYYYLDNMAEAQKIFVHEMRGTLFTIAKDVKIQVEFNPQQVKAYRLIGYESRLLKDEDFNNDTVDAGEIGSGHTVTALYEIIPASSTEAVPGIDELKYQKQVKTEASGNGEVLTIKFRYKAPDGDQSKLITQTLHGDNITPTPSPNLKFASAVAGFGMLLRDSPHKGNASFNMVKSLALANLGPDPYGYRGEFVRLADLASSLMEQREGMESKR